MMEHVIALKALGSAVGANGGLLERAGAKNNERVGTPSDRDQRVRALGPKFAPAALELLQTDGAQYVQWELLNGNLETRQGREYRNYWDIWIPANVLVALEHDDAQGRPEMAQSELDAMLDWLEAGARPRDPVVFNHMIYHLVAFTSGNDTRRLLRIFNKLPERNQNWWILQPLRDQAALPLLAYWRTLPISRDQQEILDNIIGGLSSRSPNRTASPAPCCEATEECLLQHVRQSAQAAPLANVEIHSEKEARDWLNSGETPSEKFEVHYLDELKRSAVVQTSDGKDEHWQYLYDCWRREDQPDNASTSH